MEAWVMIENHSQIFSYDIVIIQDNLAQELDIQDAIIIDPNNPENSVVVNLYVGNTLLIKEKVEIKSNVVGVLKSSGNIMITLLFRVINEETDEIVIHNVPQFHLEEFQIINRLGRGTFGESYRVIDSSKKPHVIKIMFKKMNIKYKDHVAIREIIPLISLPKHPCLINLEGFIYDEQFGLILVLELASRGSIDSINFNKLGEEKKVKLLYGLLSCVAFFHSHGFIHRDIHPSNVLVSSSYEIKLIDFGASRFYNKDMTENVGHFKYSAPEMKNNRFYDELIDEYSLGLLLKYLKIIDLMFEFIKDSLLEDVSKRITCSELCTLIESGLLCLVSKDNEAYFASLSKYHNSKPLRDNIIYYCSMYFLRNHSTDLYCDFVKLLINIGYPDSEKLYYFLDRYFKGIAQNNEYFIKSSNNKTSRYENYKSFPLPTEEKIDMLYYFLLDYSDETTLNCAFFIQYQNCSFGKKYLLQTPKRNLTTFFIHLIEMYGDIMNIFTPIMYLSEIGERENRPDIFNTYLEAANEFMILYDKINIISGEYATNLETDIIDEVKEKANKLLGPYGRDRVKIHLKCAIRYGRYESGYMLGDFYYQEKKHKKSYKYFKIAADHGNSSSMFMLGLLFLSGCHGTKDIKQGIEYLKMSANNGNPYGQYQLAIMNFHGIYMTRNFDQAFWYNCFSLKKCKLGLMLHGQFLFFGLVVPQDFVNARLIFEECLKTKDNYFANFYLGYIYMLGLGVDVDMEKGRNYFRFALKDETNLFQGETTYVPSDDVYIEVRNGHAERVERKKISDLAMYALKTGFIETSTVREYMYDTLLFRNWENYLDEKKQNYSNYYHY